MSIAHEGTMTTSACTKLLAAVRRTTLPLLMLTAPAFVGCAYPAAEEEIQADGDDQALAADEVETAVLVDKVASKDPKTTGVDRWRLSLVKKKNAPKSSKPYLVAIGTKGRAEVMDIIVGEENGEPAVRIAGLEDAQPPAALTSALAADWEHLRELLAEQGGAECAQSWLNLQMANTRALIAGGLFLACLGSSIFIPGLGTACWVGAVGVLTSGGIAYSNGYELLECRSGGVMVAPER